MARTSIVADVVTAVAAADGMDPAELDPLYEYIDPAVLEKLCEEETGEWNFTFQYSDHQVTISHDGKILVDGMTQATGSSR